MHAAQASTLTEAKQIIADHLDLEGPLLPILHALQNHFGHIHDTMVPLIAEVLNLSRAEVHGVVSFYHDFRHEAPGRHIVKLCRGESCQSRGSEALAWQLLEHLKIDWQQTSADGAFTVEAIYCLGLCMHSPAALIDGIPFGRLDFPTLEASLEDARGERLTG
jgi:formate dehydrogenase subunit gamma